MRSARTARRQTWVVLAAAWMTLGCAHRGLASEDVRTSVLRVPEGSPILLDGRIDAREWEDAAKVGSSGTEMIYLKRSMGYLLVAIRSAAPAVASVDVYFDRGGSSKLLNLHASAKLAERTGSFGAWPDWVWWNNRGWAANVARVATFQPTPTFLPDEGKEFQIDIELLNAPIVWLAVDVQAANDVLALPLAGALRNGRKWLELRL